MRPSVPRLCLIVGVYGGAIAILCKYGIAGIVTGAFVGTGIGGIVLFAGKRDIKSIAYVGFGTIAGGFFGYHLLSCLMLDLYFGYAHNLREAVVCDISGTIIGAIVGGWLFSVVWHT